MTTQTMSPGALAYAADCARLPFHHDGTVRPAWAELCRAVRNNWERHPAPRDHSAATVQHYLGAAVGRRGRLYQEWIAAQLAHLNACSDAYGLRNGATFLYSADKCAATPALRAAADASALAYTRYEAQRLALLAYAATERAA